VVYPDSTEDVVKIVNVARKYRMPIIPYSGGTSLEGHFAGVRNHLPHTLPYSHFLNTSSVLPLQLKSGGMCVDMSGMDKIIAIHGVFPLSNLRPPLLIRECLPFRRGFGPCLPTGRRVD
jgi:D-lactate dehydrogenase (cytochrome)